MTFANAVRAMHFVAAVAVSVASDVHWTQIAARQAGIKLHATKSVEQALHVCINKLSKC